MCKYSAYPKKGKVIFNESNMKQKFYCIPYYLGMRKILPEQMNKLSMNRDGMSDLNGMEFIGLGGGGENFKEVLAKPNLCQDALRIRYILMI